VGPPPRASHAYYELENVVVNRLVCTAGPVRDVVGEHRLDAIWTFACIVSASDPPAPNHSPTIG
jgi:hypothetical protein